MRILFISGYDAWNNISKGLEPSHHLYGIHQLIERYEERSDGKLYGVLKAGIIKGESYGEVDFYKWESVKKDVLQHMKFLAKEGKNYDLIIDSLNRGSLWIGIAKRLGIIKSKVITVLHHPSSYKITLTIAKSDAYVFFNEKYRDIAITIHKCLSNKFHVNEWYPDSRWYKDIEKLDCFTDALFIDNGKSERDRNLMVEAAETTQTKIDYAGLENQTNSFVSSYKAGSISHVELIGRLKSYRCIVIPVKEFPNIVIGPLGITSFLDGMALGCPIITSDNTCFASDVDKYHLGITYKTGDLNSLRESLLRMKEDEAFWETCKNNMIKYSEGKTIEKYSENLTRIINSIL